MDCRLNDRGIGARYCLRQCVAIGITTPGGVSRANARDSAGLRANDAVCATSVRTTRALCALQPQQSVWRAIGSNTITYTQHGKQCG